MHARLALLALLPAAVPAAAAEVPAAQQQAAADGTDPAWLLRTARLSFERTRTPQDFEVDSFLVEFTQPLGHRTMLRASLPVVANGVRGNNELGLGDAYLGLVHRPYRSARNALVLNGGIVVDSASRRELGSGSTVARAGATWVRFLDGGHIVAPTVEQSLSIDGSTDVNVTTLLLVTVPRLPSRRWFMTVDPLVTLDWTNDKQAAGLAGSVGYRLGPLLGGRAQIVLRPVVGIGAERALDWNLKLGFQLIDF